MLAGAMTFAIATGVVTAIATPANAVEGPHDVQSASFRAYTDSLIPNETVFYPSGGMPVGSTVDDSGVKHTSRIYVAFDVNTSYLPRLLDATMVAREYHVPDCSKARTLKAQQTAPFTAENSWANPPALIGGEVAVAANTACPAHRLTWNVTNALTRVLRQGQSRLYLEIQVGANREDKVAFGRFMDANEFKLEVTLTNYAPDVPTRLGVGTTDTPCSPDYAVNQDFGPFAFVTDRDRNPGDLVTGDIEYWNVSDPGTTFRIQTFQGSGGDGLFIFGTIRAGTLADGDYAWHARAYDQRVYSGWSVDCPFRVDRTAPALAPTVSSPEYPENPPTPTGGGLGTFLFTANGQQDVVEFVYGDTPFSLYNRIAADQPGGAATIRFQPDTGEQTLYVASYDRAFNRSPVRAYTFNVRDLGVGAWQVSQEADPSGSGINVLMHFQTQAGNGIEAIRYSVDGGPQQTVPVGEGGVVETTITGLRGGDRLLTYAGLDAEGEILYGEASIYFTVEDTPLVTSDGVYPIQGTGGGVGITGVFTVTPVVTVGVTDIEYLTPATGQWQPLPLDADGLARISYTPTQSGYNWLQVRAVYGDGTYSFTRFIWFYVA